MDKNLENNTKEIFQKIKYACEKASRCDKEITLLAATKTVSSNVIKCLLNHGITEVGENRAQELVEKYNAEFGLNWHFVGHLQTNKVKSVVGKVTLIHSLDRVSLADEINKCAEKMNIIQDVLIEINIGEEGSKSGIEVWKFDEFYQYVKSKKHLNLKGIMTVLPINAPEELYQKMNDIFLKLKKIDNNITILSMGMSDDFEKAIKFGSTLIRIGSAIFGQRQY